MTASSGRGITVALVALLALTLSAAGGQARQGAIIIQDVDLAAWTTINNTFNTNREGEWEGVLIQVGDYLDETGAVFDVFEDVTLLSRGEVVRRLRKFEFTWINIVAVDPTRGDPMDASHVGLLYPDPATPSACGDLDTCAVKRCGCDRPPCGRPAPGPLFEPCLRLRSLHGFFRPFGIITYWHGPDGYDIAVRTPSAAAHDEHTFTFNDPVQMSVDGVPLGLEQIDAVRINLKGDPNHGKKHDPSFP
jgi:hypothetical protein